MKKLPEITILVCTYDRQEDITRTVEALQDLVYYPRDLIQLIIADDSSPKGVIATLKRRKAFKFWNTAFVVTAQNSGWGANVNNAQAKVKTKYTFFIEDDYVLTTPLDLEVGVALMEEKRNIGMLRYRGTAGDKGIIYHQREADISQWCPDYQDGVGLPGRLTWLALGGGSPSLYLYSHGAHLKRGTFHNFYGPYPEGKKLGATEESYAHTVKDKMRADPNHAPIIAILPKWIPQQFDHIGQSRQLTALDKGEG